MIMNRSKIEEKELQKIIDPKELLKKERERKKNRCMEDL